MATFMKNINIPKCTEKPPTPNQVIHAATFSPRPPDSRLCSLRRRCGREALSNSSHSSSNLLRHSQHLLRIIQMCHCFLMGIMLSRQSGRLHQMCTGGGDLRKLTLCCKTNGRKLISRYSSHYGRRRGRGSVHGCARLGQDETRLMRVGGRWPPMFLSVHVRAASDLRRVHTGHSNVLEHACCEGAAVSLQAHEML